MQQAGAREGSLLFSGRYQSNNTYSGTAYIFSAKCGKFPYAVSGPVSTDFRAVVMYRDKPLVNHQTCTISGYERDELVFEYQSKLWDPTAKAAN